VGDESTEAKIEEGDSFCALGIVNWPGFPLQKLSTLGIADATVFGYHMPLHSILAAKIEKFDRANRMATISLRSRSGKTQEAFDALMNSGIIPIGKEPIYLMEGLPYNDTVITRSILKEIGNPACAKTATESLEAMGKPAAKKIPKGTDDDTPVARILWAADKLSSAKIRTGAEVQALSLFAKTANKHALNDSQYAAVTEAAAAQLSIIWGPPGTGKTDTLVAFLHGVIREGKQRKILLSGPNYRTVEELGARLAGNLTQDPKAACDFYWVYSRNRDPKVPSGAAPHLDLKSFTINCHHRFKMPAISPVL